jgi:hypothetical protein
MSTRTHVPAEARVRVDFHLTPAPSPGSMREPAPPHRRKPPLPVERESDVNSADVVDEID